MLELNPEELKKKKKFKANLERVGENMLFVNYYYYFTFWKSEGNYQKFPSVLTLLGFLALTIVPS